MRGGKKVIIEPHQRLEGVFIARGKEDALCTKNFVVGESVYGEKRVSVDGDDGQKIEYRVWNPFRSKLGASILGGVENIHIKPGNKVLYLGAASGTTVSHVSDIVGAEGRVYAVEFSHRSGRDLLGVAQKRSNVVPIIEDARHPHKYRMLISMVDTIFADVAQPDQARIVLLNAQYFLKIGGHVVISIKVDTSTHQLDLPLRILYFSRQIALIQLPLPKQFLLLKSRNCSRNELNHWNKSLWSHMNVIMPSLLASTGRVSFFYIKNCD